MDGDLEQRRAGRRAHFMVSDDSGATWRIVHRFAADWSDAPERFLLLSRDPVEVLTDGTDRPCILRLPSAAR